MLSRMSFPDKQKRKQCWDARDEYWKCLDKNAPEHSTTGGEPEPTVCEKFRKLFAQECPGQWVTHFDRKRSYEQFKKKMEAGYDPLSAQK